jgi:hypothetical protein
MIFFALKMTQGAAFFLALAKNGEPSTYRLQEHDIWNRCHISVCILVPISTWPLACKINYIVSPDDKHLL